MENESFTVSEITSYLAKKIMRDSNLKNIYITGEISNFKAYSKGHCYFTLKDNKSQIPAVMFKNNKDRFLKFEPKDGMKVIIKGKIEVYEKGGKYQLYATRMNEYGLGDLHVAFEQLKKKLEKEGLFDKTHKKEIPKYPKRIGVITAQTGAAIKDIMTTIKRRYPVCEVLVFSTLVQGSQAAPQIIKQIKHAEEFNLDTLIIGRGGGSIEDLWSFNEEKVARAIYACEIPIISAVGHEIDYTIADFVADKRAATPTAAAEIAVPDMEKVKDYVKQINIRLNKSINHKIGLNKTKLNSICNKNIIKNPESIYEIREMHLDNLIDKLSFSSKNILSENKNKLIRLENSSIFKNPESLYELKKINLNNIFNKLNYVAPNIINKNRTKLLMIEKSYILKNPKEIIRPKKDKYIQNLNKLTVLDPLQTLKRGYTIAKSKDKIISSAKDVKTGDEIDIEFDDGIINTKVI